MRLSKFTPSRLMYTVVGNLSTGYCCCKCFCCNMIVHEVRRKRVKCHYTSNRQLHTVLLKLQRYYKTPTLTYFEPYYPITREHAAVIYKCVHPDDGIFFFLWHYGPTRAMASSFLRFLDHTRWRITVGRTPLDEWSARRRDLYLKTHNNHNRQISMLPVGFEPTIWAGERPQTYALGRAATGTGKLVNPYRTNVENRVSS